MSGEDDKSDDQMFDDLVDALDVILDHEMKKYNRWYDSLTPLEQYRHERRRMLTNCLNWRRYIKELGIPELRDYLRRSQRGLLRIRRDLSRRT